MTVRKDRRQSRRIATELDLTVAGLDHARIAARTLNLSAGGAYLELDRPLAPLAKLELKITLPAFADSGDRGNGEHPLITEAVVVRTEPDGDEGNHYRVAVAFMNMSPRDRNRLEDYIEWLVTRTLLESVDSIGGV